MSEISKKIRTLVGKVVSNAMDKTIVVSIVREVPHPKYGKYIKRKTNLLVHDSENKGAIGDVAVIRSARPISKRKHYQLVEILNR